MTSNNYLHYFSWKKVFIGFAAFVLIILAYRFIAPSNTAPENPNKMVEVELVVQYGDIRWL